MKKEKEKLMIKMYYYFLSEESEPGRVEMAFASDAMMTLPDVEKADDNAYPFGDCVDTLIFDEEFPEPEDEAQEEEYFIYSNQKGLNIIKYNGQNNQELFISPRKIVDFQIATSIFDFFFTH